VGVVGMSGIAVVGAILIQRGGTEMRNLKILPWHDLHGDAVVFQIIDKHGFEVGRYASEVEAKRKLAELKDLPSLAGEN
jgi:hypothetical protein